MDRPDLPSADELGLTDLEYERILRGLKQREQAGERAPADARDLVENTAGRIEYRGSDEVTLPVTPTPPPRFRWQRRALGAVLGAVVASAVLHHTFSSPGPEYRFIDSNSYGDPVTYSSCKPVRIEIYPAGGPPDAEALVREAVAILRSATGLDIVVTGVFGGHATNWNFTSGALRLDDPVSISWQDEGAIAALTNEKAGLGGSAVATTPHGTPYLVAGAVALSRSYFADRDKVGDQAHERAVILHELGHVLGLDHVDSRNEIMYPSVGATELGPGDLEGLRRLGQGPCV